MIADRTRRSFLQKAGATFTTSLLAFDLGAAQGTGYAEDDVRRYGVAPNSAAAASANTATLKALVDPAGTFSGRLSFPNTAGSDVYYFNDLIAFHDGIHLDLKGSTLSFSKIGGPRDTDSGFIHAIRDFVIENGALVTNYQFNGGHGTGCALAFGGRGKDTAFFPDLYDRILPAPMGNITVRNLRITARASGGDARGILMLGGFDGVLIDNVSIDGQGQLVSGIYYEFGWATNEANAYERQSSHARNFRVANLTVARVTDEAFGAMGAYDIVIDGLRASDCGFVCMVGTGEALYFRPWTPSAAQGQRPSIVLRNVVGERVGRLGISVTGASNISGSYLDNPPKHNNPNGITADQMTDLIGLVVENFSLSGSAKNFGIATSAASARISNGVLTGFERGIVTTQECTEFLIDSVKIFDSASFGMQIGQAVTLHTPPRLSEGVVRDCVIAGSGTHGKCAGLVVGTTRSCLIEGCRFGYDKTVDDRTEESQTEAVVVLPDSAGVVCRNDFVAATADGAVAYSLIGSAGRECRIENARGIQTTSGAWR